MSAKFVKDKENNKWLVEITCETTGSKQPEVGDLVKVKRSCLKITEVLEIKGVPETYGCKYLCDFVNF